ncbi:MAG: hypothetical protein OEV94_12070 [Deltaproteobacteria bacterium]|nr:hypothetical protein [Deltaproteobacteria bacterium]
MANTLLTPTTIIRETLLLLEATCPMLETVNTDWEQYYTGGAGGTFKKGAQLSLRKPNRYLSLDGPTITGGQDTVEPSVNLNINQQKVIALEFQDKDLTLTIDRFAERYLKPAVSQLRTDMEVYVNAVAKNGIFNAVGAIGTIPNTPAAFGAATQRLDEYNVPMDSRNAYLNPATMTAIRTAAATGALPAVFSQRLVEGALLSDGSQLPYNLLNVNTYMGQATPQHTAGAQGGTPVVNGASQVGSFVVTSGWTASVTGVLLQGDVIQFGATDAAAGAVLACNPQTRLSTGVRACWLVTANVNSDGVGNATIPIYPAISPMSGTTAQKQQATCMTSPLNGQTIVVVTGTASKSTVNNIVMHKDCVTLAMVPMDVPEKGVIWAVQETYKGMTLRMVQAYDVLNDKRITRLDALFGAVVQYPELGARLIY